MDDDDNADDAHDIVEQHELQAVQPMADATERTPLRPDEPRPFVVVVDDYQVSEREPEPADELGDWQVICQANAVARTHEKTL